MKNYIALLPEEVISKIISYSYSPQSKELCEDVRSYKKTEAYLKKNYRKDYKHEADAMGWLANNIYRFLNDDLPTIYGYQPSFINIFKRPIQNHVKSDTEIINYIENLSELSISDYRCIDVNISIALLNISERIQLINWLDNLRWNNPLL